VQGRSLTLVLACLLPCVGCADLLGYDDLTVAPVDAATPDGSVYDASFDGTAGAAGSSGSGGSPGSGGSAGSQGGAAGSSGEAGAAGSGGAPPACPNGTCADGETCDSCPQDCGPCCAHAPVACGKTGAQTLDATAEFKQFLQACPRVAKWVSGGGYADFGGMQDYKCACQGGAAILRIWGPAASYATGDDLWNARYAFLDGATADQKAAVDYLESDNECDSGHCFDDAAGYNTFLLQWVARAKAAGFKPLIGNIAVGNPGGDVETCSGDGMQKFGAIVPAILAAAKAGGGWGYHSYTNYWAHEAGGMNSYLTFRYRRYLDCHPELANVPLIMTEAGFDKGGNPDADGWKANGSSQTYLDWLKWYQTEIAKDGPVFGAALFTFAPAGNWSSFRLDSIAGELAGLVKSCP